MTTGTETDIIAGASVEHSHASIDQIEAVAAESQGGAVESLLERPAVTEAFVLQTCNRAEAYVVAGTADAGREALSAYLGNVDDDTVREFGHEGSLRHIMSVACGLESLVLGEDQILGQVRNAYEEARGAGGIGPTLDDAVLKALHVGERARNETTINEGVLSVGSAAVRFAKSKRDLEGETALVVGAGEIATLAAKSLSENVPRVIVANRTLPHAEHLAEQLDVETSAVGLGAIEVAAAEAGVVISATGSDEYVVDDTDLEAAGETCVIDIAQPRDVDPEADGGNVSVYDLDAIESITDETRAKRRVAAETVESMIDEELDHLLAQYKRKRADRVIAAMYEGAERIKSRELQTAISKLEAAEGDLGEEERDILESMADALVGQLLSAPTRSLREAAENDDWSTISTALRLFGPGLQPEPSIPERPDGPAEADVPEEMRERIPVRIVEQLEEE